MDLELGGLGQRLQRKQMKRKMGDSLLKWLRCVGCKSSEQVDWGSSRLKLKHCWGWS